jgi:sugar/nucleoside kinase (ribokinase family)
VIKRGSQGALARVSKDKFVAPSFNVQAIDHVGAGDSFDAGFLHEFVRGKVIEDCLKFGNVLGALSVTRPGGTEAFRDAEYRDSFLRAHGGVSDEQDVARTKK